MHRSVLLQEVVSGLEAKAGEVILDATVGGGGHSEAICESLNGTATFVCLDADGDAIERSKERLKKCGCTFLFYQTNFRHLDTALAKLGVSGINRAIFDLGLSSFQLEESGRGFSFMRDEPLQMTFAGEVGERGLTAETVVNEWSEDTLATIIGSYGEERQARRIAARIVDARQKKPIATTKELTDIVASVVRRRGRIHPATKTFQAIRVAVNDEFQALKEGLFKAWEKLLPGGRVAVISFQSLEDRTVKNFFRALGKEGVGVSLAKKPVVPSEAEVRENPRARSAKLRIIERKENT